MSYAVLCFMKRSIFIIITFLLPFFASAQNIGERTIRFNDTTRKRPLVTEVWYPTADTVKPGKDFKPFLNEATVKDGAIGNGKYPLILISHGTGGGRLTLEWLADNLVRHGFIVAAVDHWGNTYDNKIAIDFVTPWERARDISFVLSGLLSNKAFGTHIDTGKIGAAGFSIGGYTVIALAGAQLDIKALEQTKEVDLPEFPNLFSTINMADVRKSYDQSPASLKDQRIKAFFAICPAIGQGFVKTSQFKDINKPVYIVGAENDSIAPYKTNAAHYHKLIPGSKFLLIKGKAGHYVFLSEAAEPVKKQAPVYFTDDPSVDRHAIHQQVGDLASEFFKSELK